MDCVENHPKKYNLLKKLAFTEVYNLDSSYQVTLVFLLNFEAHFFLFWKNVNKIVEL